MAIGTTASADQITSDIPGRALRPGTHPITPDHEHLWTELPSGLQTLESYANAIADYVDR